VGEIGRCRSGQVWIQALSMGVFLLALGAKGCGSNSLALDPAASGLDAGIASAVRAATGARAQQRALVDQRGRAGSAKVKGPRARPAGKAGESIAESEKTSRKSPRRHRSASHRKASRKHVDRGGSNDHDVLRVPSQAPQVFEDYIAGAQQGQSVCHISCTRTVGCWKASDAVINT
jgi:hypothetical protein